MLGVGRIVVADGIALTTTGLTIVRGCLEWGLAAFVILPLGIGGLSSLLMGVVNGHGALALGGLVAVGVAGGILSWLGVFD